MESAHEELAKQAEAVSALHTETSELVAKLEAATSAVKAVS